MFSTVHTLYSHCCKPNPKLPSYPGQMTKLITNKNAYKSISDLQTICVKGLSLKPFTK